jgi:hypothetical protein
LAQRGFERPIAQIGHVRHRRGRIADSAAGAFARRR